MSNNLLNHFDPRNEEYEIDPETEARMRADAEYYKFETITVLVPVKMKVHHPTSVVMTGSIEIPTAEEIETMYQQNQLMEFANPEDALRKKWTP